MKLIIVISAILGPVSCGHFDWISDETENEVTTSVPISSIYPEDFQQNMFSEMFPSGLNRNGVRESTTEEVEETTDLSEVPDNCNEKIDIILLTFADYITLSGRTLLQPVAKRGLVKVAKLLIKGGANVNRRDDFGKNALHYSAENGHAGIVSLLIENGAEVNFPDRILGQTALHLAAKSGNEKCVQLLIESGAFVNVKDKNGDEPLQIAFKEGKQNIVNLLIETRGQTGKKLLHVAVESADIKLIEILIANGVDINAKDDSGDTPLHLAAKKDNSTIAHMLINNGADVNATDNYESTALHIAASHGFIDFADLLVKAKANLNIENKNGDTPLKLAKVSGFKSLYEDMLLNNGKKAGYSQVYDYPEALIDAASNGNYERVEKLVNSLDVNKQNNVGDTALIRASETDNIDIVKCLIINGANVQLSNHNLQAPLHVAASNGNVPIADQLIRNDANVNVADNMGETPLLLAVKSGRKDMVEYLISRGANVSLGDRDKLTPLHSAAEKGHMEIADLLIQNCAHINSKTISDQRTPLHLAAIIGNAEIVQLLINNGANIELKDKYNKSAMNLVHFNQGDRRGVWRILSTSVTLPERDCFLTPKVKPPRPSLSPAVAEYMMRTYVMQNH